MIDDVARGNQLSDDVMNEIIAKTDGVPPFVEELTKTILSSHTPAWADSHRENSRTTSLSSIPETLQDSLTARLDRLPKGREVAQLGSVLGREFTYEMISGISMVDESTLIDGLESLVSDELLHQYGHPPQSRYSFKHALIRDSAYQSLLKRIRRQYHERVAGLMIERFPETADTQPELIAHHFTEAACPERAVIFWLRAGALAASKSANVEAVDHYRRGLEVVSKLADSDGRALHELDLQVGLGSALVATKYTNHVDVGKAYARAWELCQQLEDYSRGFLALRGRQLHSLGRGEFEESQRFAEEALHVADQLDNAAYRVGAHMALGVTLFYQGKLNQALPHFQRGSDIYDPKEQVFSDWPGSEPGVQCQFWPVLISWMLGYSDQAMAKRDRALKSADATGHALTIAQTLCTSSLLHVLRREPSKARSYVERALEICSEQRINHWNAFGLVLHGWVLSTAGESDKGLAEIEEGVDSYGLGGNQHILLTLQASAELASGFFERALLTTETGLNVVRKMGGAPFEAELYRLKGEVLAAGSGGACKAEAALKKGIEVAQRQSAKSWELRSAVGLARLWQQQGKKNEVTDLLLPLVDRSNENLTTPDLIEAKSLIGK